MAKLVSANAITSSLEITWYKPRFFFFFRQTSMSQANHSKYFVLASSFPQPRSTSSQKPIRQKVFVRRDNSSLVRRTSFRGENVARHLQSTSTWRESDRSGSGRIFHRLRRLSPLLRHLRLLDPPANPCRSVSLPICIVPPPYCRDRARDFPRRYMAAARC